MYRALAMAAAVVPAIAFLPQARAQAACRFVQLEMTPSDDLQIVVWIEDTEGNYMDTAFITRLTGTFGLGNRPGMQEFNSGPLWPYGRRLATFPVWAHRHGQTWPLVIFQDEDDLDLSHAISQSSLDQFYCRPIRPEEDAWDTGTCASPMVYTDKGKLSTTETSRYPPRSDVERDTAHDHSSVDDMVSSNPFDAVSRATPAGGELFDFIWGLPFDFPNGEYIAFIEVSKEFDQNEHYDYPSPVGISWSEYGAAYRGQPSVVYSVPFSISQDAFSASTMEYTGYGDPDGMTGSLFPPDETITTSVPGSGAGRLLVTSDGGETFRVRVTARAEEDFVAPGELPSFEPVEVTSQSITASFVAPGDDAMEGTVAAYEIRYQGGEPITEDNFQDALLAPVHVEPAEAGTEHVFELTELLPKTNYYIAIKAIDECHNSSPISTVQVTTPPPEPGEVSACFVATAAYGSPLVNQVRSLRMFRDRYLRTNVPGELFVESYYTFGPALARFIEPSPLLRRTARDLLEPLASRISELP